MPQIDILIIPISTPLLIGIYQDLKLIDTITTQDKISDYLPLLIKELNAKYSINEILYVNGPGSYMAIKLTYIFLETLKVVNNQIVKAVNGFEFNNNMPIKAIGNKYFIIDENKSIKLIQLDKKLENSFSLPNIIDKTVFSEDIEPIYFLPAV